MPFTRRYLLATPAILAAIETRDASAQDAPVRGGTLIYLEQQTYANLYPPASGHYPAGGVINQITDKLTYQNPRTLEIEPWIAESWTINANATEYTFKLRPGVTFSDGSPLNAEAVAKNYDTYGLGNRQLRHAVSEVVANYLGSDVIDPLTVRFRFRAPSPGFLQGTSVIGSGLVSLGTLALPFDQMGDATKIIGSGPFVVARQVLGRELVLNARRDYAWGPAKHPHQGRALLDTVRIIVNGEDSVRVGALLSGQAHLARQVPAFDESRIQARGFQVFAPPTRGVNNSITFRPDNPLVAELAVRRALLHGTNAQEIVATLFSPNYPQATSVIAATAQGYVNLADRLTFDPALAAKLLDEAGWTMSPQGIRQKAGTDLALTAYESPNYARSKDTMQLVAQQWTRLGVRFSVMAGDLGSRAVDSLDPAKTPVSPAMVGRADPDVIRSNYYPTTRNMLLQTGGVSRRVQSFSDPALNALLEGIASEPDQAKRLALVGDVQRYIIDKAYVIPLFEEPQVFAGSPRVRDMGFEAVGRPSFYGAWLAAR